MWGKGKNNKIKFLENEISILRNKIDILETDNTIKIGSIPDFRDILYGRDFRPSISLRNLIDQIMNHLNLELKYHNISVSLKEKNANSSKSP